MYLQIIDQIKDRIAADAWPSGHRLPSIRELAVFLNVSVITVKRAYQELESDGVIYTQHGKGSFVADGENMGVRLKQQELDQHLRAALQAGGILGLSADEVAARIHLLIKEDQEPTSGEHNV